MDAKVDAATGSTGFVDAHRGGDRVARMAATRSMTAGTTKPGRYPRGRWGTAAVIGLLVWMLSFAAVGVGQTVLYVDADAPPLGNGRSWATAFDLLQFALAFADESTEIWVAEGTYLPDYFGNRSSSFVLEKSRLSLYGGFRGDEVRREDRDPARYPTILSGDLLGDDLPGWTNRRDNSASVVVIGGGRKDVVIDGFTIRGAWSTDAWHEAIAGGIVAHSYSEGTVSNCIIEDCYTKKAGGGMNGGYDALYDLIACTFRGNHADKGGGVYYYARFLFDGCRFEGNSADRSGGGVASENARGSEMRRCTFVSNHAGAMGGGLFADDCRMLLVNNLFVGNTSLDIGGALGFWNSSSSTIVNCTLIDNEGFVGGAVGADSEVKYSASTVTIANSILRNNGPEVRVANKSEVLISSSLVAGGYPGDGNFSCNPYLDAVSWAPRPGSPVIDRGRNADAAGLLVDLFGNERFIDDPGTPDRGSGLAPLVDLGAIEFQGITWRSTISTEPANPRAGENIEVTMSAGLADAPAWVVASLREGGGCTYIESIDVIVDLDRPELIGGPTRTDPNGSAAFAIHIPIFLAHRTVHLQAVQSGRTSEVIARVVEGP